ncbi:hypothetical protein HanIR_Chr12g0606981 [Helianthus annuus]|nr:hypothetical protein HanIR_Chr12g0606981 [Helianthus annuus]
MGIYKSTAKASTYKVTKISDWESFVLADQLCMGWPQRESMELEEMLKDELELKMAFSCCLTLNDIWMSLCL